jgi:hypothetical protein
MQRTLERALAGGASDRARISRVIDVARENAAAQLVIRESHRQIAR